MSYTDGACDSVQQKNEAFNKLLAEEHPVDPRFMRSLIEAAESKDEARVAKVVRTIIAMHAMQTSTNVKNFLEEEFKRIQAEIAKQKADAAAAMARASHPHHTPAPGTRVVAICNDDSGIVSLFGFGVYQGDKPCPYLGGAPNPHIVMDDGTHMWGCICWWGDEAQFNASEEAKRPRRMVKVDGTVLGPCAPLPTGTVPSEPAAESPVEAMTDAALADALKEMGG